MSSAADYLHDSLHDLEDTVSDFRSSSFQSSPSLLARLVAEMREEPLAGFLRSVLPQVDIQTWLKEGRATIGSIIGSGNLQWPADRSERVAMQIALCEALASKQIDFVDFVHHFYHSGSNLQAHVHSFTAQLLDPLLRDVRRLTNTRAIPPVLFEAMGKLPPSGDSILDSILQDACAKFRDPTPKARAEAVEKLWDAWERLKTIEREGNKRLSTEQLLDRAATEPTMRAYLESEAKTLTEIGNRFHIRHFETDKVELSRPEHQDYLFHRLYSLMHLLLYSRGGET